MINTSVPKKSVEIRQDLFETLKLDLVGPDNDHPFSTELLPEPPVRWYLTGFLAPTDAFEQRYDDTSTEEIDAVSEPGGLDDDVNPDRQAASTVNRRSLLPGSMGLSVLIPTNTLSLKVKVDWGDYKWEGPQDEKQPEEDESSETDKSVSDEAYSDKDETPNDLAGEKKPLKGYRRTPRTETLVVQLPESGDKPAQFEIPDSNGILLVVTVREATLTGLPEGSKAVSVFLVNSRISNGGDPTELFTFQVRMEIRCDEQFIARSDPRSWGIEDEWDQRVADVQYRDCCEFAVGHGTSVKAVTIKDAATKQQLCKLVKTTWIPDAEVELVTAAKIAGAEFVIETLGNLADATEAQSKLQPLVDQYRSWISRQQSTLGTLNSDRTQTANEMLHDASNTADRIEAGIKLLADSDTFEAFSITNRVIAKALRQRAAQNSDHKDPSRISPPEWRPFQLAFFLMTLRGIVEPTHADREEVDLLFFPTGGGKTEAYLALAAFTIIFRRIRSRGADEEPDITSSGVSVLMRYTLRLLTLDQLGRAAGLICALELEREQHPDKLGTWPFEIGLWVGQAATPNIMGHRGDRSSQSPYSAYTKTMQFKRDPRKPSPIPLEECPWCGEKFGSDSFRLEPNLNSPLDLRVHCINHKCAFSGDRHLPIVSVDEPVYRRLPCFLIATVDKFAALPWTGRTGTLFGKVDRYDQNGFYGPCDPGAGTALPEGQLPPPDLIIQDELHLISGPLGTVAGLYETVIDALATRQLDDVSIGPKIIASTATVRRAQTQIRALFGRSRVSVFPPPGPDRRDSFFSKTVSSDISPARLYVGIAAQGRSLKVVLLRVVLALLSAGQKAWIEAGGKVKPNHADPYMTLLGYFNSLRELGGSRRIVEDEVTTRLQQYGRRKRLDPVDDLFESRSIQYEVTELTSRVSTNDVANAKRRLALDFTEKEHVDVALATNMISVGLDITRLGLMTVLGQPKTSAEYIQTTSRVGRDPERPGLVLTLLNIHKPRDRSHYERFTAYHNSFYRNVEPTSVTPFSPRALDRALSAVLVALCRQQSPVMTPPQGAQGVIPNRTSLDEYANQIAERARNHTSSLSTTESQALFANVLQRCGDLLDDWVKIAKQAYDEGSSIQYQREMGQPPRKLLFDFLDPELANLPEVYRRFRANRSMRDVEAAVDITINNLD